jgi:hypothetical protein
MDNPRVAKLAIGVSKGKVLKKEFAGVINVDTTTVGYHFKNCKLDPTPFARPRERTDDQFAEDLKDLEALLPTLILRVKTWLSIPVDHERTGSEKAISTLIREGRGLAKDLALLKGQLQTPAMVKVNQLNIQYNQLQNIILGELCDHCQRQILKRLPVIKA